MCGSKFQVQAFPTQTLIAGFTASTYSNPSLLYHTLP